MTSIILTVQQARQLQRQQLSPGDYGEWNFLLTIPLPQQPNQKNCAARNRAALKMLEMGCGKAQIAEQLKWSSVPMTKLTMILETITNKSRP